MPKVKTMIMRWRNQSKRHLIATIKKLKNKIDLYAGKRFRKIDIAAWEKVIDWLCKGIHLILKEN